MINEDERIADYIERLEQERDAATAREAVLRGCLERIIRANDPNFGNFESQGAAYASAAGVMTSLARAALATPSSAAEALLALADAAVSRYELLHAWDVSVYDGNPDTELRDRVGIADTCLDLATKRYQQAAKGEQGA